MEEIQKKLNKIFFALSDPTRRDILTRLLGGALNMGELASQYTISLAAISKHIRALEDAELVCVHKQGRNRVATLLVENLGDAQIWLSTLNDESVIFDGLEAEIEALSKLQMDI